MIVGEAPGADEKSQGIPFVGASGMELNRMLGEVGIGRNECFVTNVIRSRPPNNDVSFFFAKAKKDITREHILIKKRHCLPAVRDGLDLLRKELALVKPNIVIALGGTALWALTGREGPTKWRGSMLLSDVLSDGKQYRVIPTIHPAAVLRE